MNKKMTQLFYIIISKINDHFKFQILCINIFNYRERLETEFMYILNTIHPFGLNAVVADYNNNFETYRFNF